MEIPILLVGWLRSIWDSLLPGRPRPPTPTTEALRHGPTGLHPRRCPTPHKPRGHCCSGSSTLAAIGYRQGDVRCDLLDDSHMDVGAHVTASMARPEGRVVAMADASHRTHDR